MPYEWRSSSFFIPAQNSRHRTACLALYRALLTLSPKVPLPPDLATAWPGPRNPIAHVVRRSFARNLTDTSPRLVFPALAAGYRMLDTLSRARDPATPEHASVLGFLRARLAKRKHILEMKALKSPKPAPRPSSAPNASSVPLLVRTTPEPTRENPNPKPSYAAAARPRPRDQLPPGAKRKIPVLDMAADFPILRLNKPQPAELSRVLTQRIRRRVGHFTDVEAFTDESLPECEEEDAWEQHVMDLLDAEVLGPSLKAGRVVGDGAALARAADEVEAWVGSEGATQPTYAHSLRVHGIRWTMDWLTREREDAVARADAMRKIIADETALAAREREQDRAGRRARWEARMRAEHGDGWAEVVAEEKRARDLRRQQWLAERKAAREAEFERRRQAEAEKRQTTRGGKRQERSAGNPKGRTADGATAKRASS
ncbi:hypothetical protein JX265_001188 [Neoarthrinium moseri]|uniref:Uncharacterized protein n=1 Tax=Neoarthrinium moseri TaxID=1658444 RepID=A0A9P9WX88_9PEZI|nr:hypothetical protein JX266_005286 [Neoarthrinium moseri]KAI1880948.1 hypothetical protein JX265_001188 [Neoarthrinium moseri]